jgi:hypothetical protein
MILLAKTSLSTLGTTAAPHTSLEDFLTSVLRRDHTSYVALAEIEARVAAKEKTGEAASGADLLLLAGGFLAGDVRALREYLRLHGEVVPRPVRARMTLELARLLATASESNRREAAWTILLPRLDTAWLRPAGVNCTLHANGFSVGPLPTVQLRVVSEAPQRFHVVCDDGFAAVARIVPVAASAPVEVALGPHSGHVVSVGRSSSSMRKGSHLEAPKAPSALRDEGNPRGSLGITGSLFALGRPSQGRSGRPHNLGLVDGLFARGGLRWTTPASAVPLGVALYFARTSRPATAGRGESSALTRKQALTHSDAWNLELSWRPSLHPRVRTPVEVGLWHWHCPTRPCGPGAREPGITLGVGLALTPVDSGINVEISAIPGIVANETPTPFLDLKAVVQHEW